VYVTGLHLGKHITQDDVAKVSEKSKLTIRNRYQDIIEAIDLELKGRRGRNSE